MYIGIHVKHPIFLSDFNKTLNSLDRFSKNTQMSNFMKISPVGVELFHADARTDGHTSMTKLIIAFRNYVKAPKELRDIPVMECALLIG